MRRLASGMGDCGGHQVCICSGDGVGRWWLWRTRGGVCGDSVLAFWRRRFWKTEFVVTVALYFGGGHCGD